MSVEVDLAVFNDRIQRYVAEFDVDIKLVVKDQARLLVKRMLDFVPPKSRKDGLTAIDIDLSKQFVSGDYLADKFTHRDKKLEGRVKGYIKNKNHDALMEVIKDTGILESLEPKPFNPSDIKRNTRGRIITNRKKILISDVRPLKTYQKKLGLNVGKLKGSIAAVYQKLGGKVPAWLARHTANDIFIDGLQDKDNPAITIGSLVDYASTVDRSQNILQRALQGRERDMIKSIKNGVLNKAQQAYYGVSR